MNDVLNALQAEPKSLGDNPLVKAFDSLVGKPLLTEDGILMAEYGRVTTPSAPAPTPSAEEVAAAARSAALAFAGFFSWSPPGDLAACLPHYSSTTSLPA